MQPPIALTPPHEAARAVGCSPYHESAMNPPGYRAVVPMMTLPGNWALQHSQQ